MAKKKRRKSRKLPYSGMLMLNGDPAIGINFFNRYFNDLDKKNDQDVSETIPDAISDTTTDSNSSDSAIGDSGSNSSAGGIGESIKFKKAILNEFDTEPLEEKRETKRYYIRPQHIFCANKLDVLKALIQVTEAGENCSVYTLKNLDDHDDVHKLTNDDIIYYYDDNVLYDKNHVMVMDYDLYIKHEEERPNFRKDPDKISKAEYQSDYDDRMTKETVLESLDFDVNDEESIMNFMTQIEAGDEVSIGRRDEGKPTTFKDGSRYSDTEYFATRDDDAYVIFSVDKSDEGAESEPEDYFICNTPEELVQFIKRNFDFKDFNGDTQFKDSFENTLNHLDEFMIDDQALIDDLKSATNLEDAVMLLEQGVSDWPLFYDYLPDDSDTEDFAQFIVDKNQTASDEDDMWDFDENLTESAKEMEDLTEDTENEFPSICSICGEPYRGYGNNAEPYAHGRCCDACNFKFVIPERIRLMNRKSRKQNESLNEDTNSDNLDELIGKTIRIIYMKDDWSGKDYDGREGTITEAALDPWGDLYYRGTWGDLAIYPSEDKIEFID